MVSIPDRTTAAPKQHHILDTSSSWDSENESFGQWHELSSEQSHNNSNMSGTGTGTVEVSTGQRMASATLGSVLTSLLVTPLDVVRVRLQSQPKPTPIPINLSRFPAYATSFEKLPPDLGIKACCREVFFVGDNAQVCLAGNGHTATSTAVDCAVEETQKRTYNSTIDGIRKIARNEGTLVLWRGLSPTLAMAIPANVIYFAGYDWLRYNKTSPIPKMSNETYNPVISGALARVLSGIAVSPIEMFRTRMQASSGSATGLMRETMDGLYRMTQTQGYTSLWRGLALTMWRDVPFSGIYWLGYEQLRTAFSNARQAAKGDILGTKSGTTTWQEAQLGDSHTTTFVDSFVAGALAGGFSALVTTPFDVGKTRRQVFVHEGDDARSTIRAVKEAAKHTGKVVPEELPMLRFLFHILKEEGMSGLFKGWGARCLKVAPACAIMISSYEIGKRFAQNSNTKKETKSAAL